MSGKVDTARRALEAARARRIELQRQAFTCRPEESAALARAIRAAGRDEASKLLAYNKALQEDRQ